MKYTGTNVWIAITQETLDLAKISTWCTVPNCGAIVNFVGTTRDHFEHKMVSYLSYEAYTEMAISELRSICEEALQKFPGTLKACIHHRLGRVDVTETSIICSLWSRIMWWRICGNASPSI